MPILSGFPVSDSSNSIIRKEGLIKPYPSNITLDYPAGVGTGPYSTTDAGWTYIATGNTFFTQGVIHFGSRFQFAATDAVVMVIPNPTGIFYNYVSGFGEYYGTSTSRQIYPLNGNIVTGDQRPIGYSSQTKGLIGFSLFYGEGTANQLTWAQFNTNIDHSNHLKLTVLLERRKDSYYDNKLSIKSDQPKIEFGAPWNIVRRHTGGAGPAPYTLTYTCSVVPEAVKYEYSYTDVYSDGNVVWSYPQEAVIGSYGPTFSRTGSLNNENMGFVKYYGRMRAIAADGRVSDWVSDLDT